MHESLLGDTNRERLRAIQAETSQKKDLNLQAISSTLRDAATPEALHPICLELFHHVDALLATHTNGQEDQQSSSTQASSLAPNRESLHVRSLVDLVAQKLLQFPSLSNDAAVKDSDYATHSLVAEAGLALLVIISLFCASPSEPFLLDDAVLISVVTYTDEDDAWTTKESSHLAARLLKANLADDRLDTFITQRLIQDTLRPLFSKSSTRLTASGRPSQLAQQPASTQARTSLDSVSQEREKLQAASSFKWAVMSCSQATMGRHWPLFLPILLSLAEDHNTAVRIKGLQILGLFLDTCPANVILSAGVDNVIQDAVFPTLLFLPSTTPESESIELLYPAYRVLLRIAQLDPDSKSLRRRRFLDKLLRDGVFVGHFHASEYPRIVEVLMKITKDIVSCLGFFSAKHLQVNNRRLDRISLCYVLITFGQNLLRLFASTLSDPFVMGYPPLVYSTTEALNATLVNCWPRFSSPGYIDQVIHTISLCWLNLKSSQLPAEDVDQISAHLTRTSTILHSLWSREGSGPIEGLTAAVQKEPRLAELFPSILT
ncbi:hypothetical protein M441DRAFT_458883 [Trichoderma asperellum CBS 433.97]|uniref:Uncharacterized protein n=1 Tax=Trichoderma asperellum (strain ATCC 204424 / CBS 433.97 / NBRC 101777) TaxID=1042311 RepID=A0A2T3Z4N4_TRIA4|nr:hypothetical protein M441DRAFT_458883 [Trichoderma asperellum CBS 433.97]PTB39786.1 hypothetical protein M441DRAFT_458883 [Trichoderma asperellum CBS 433.97]